MSEGHWFELAAHRDAFLAQIQAGQVDLKFSYAGSAAGTHQRLAESDGYSSVTRHPSLELDALSAFDPPTPPIFVDIGPGDGAHSESLLAAVLVRTKLDSYIGVDFSRQLLAASARRLLSSGQLLDIVDWSFHVRDLEQDPFHLAYSDSTRIFTILGNTLGNVWEPVSFVRRACASAKRGDYLLASVARASGATDATKAYDNEAFRAAVLEPFLAIGVAEEAIELDLRWTGSAVEAWLHFTRKVAIHGALYGIDVVPGKEVLCFRSRRFDREGAQRLIRGEPWSLARVAEDDDGIAFIARRN